MVNFLSLPGHQTVIGFILLRNKRSYISGHSFSSTVIQLFCHVRNLWNLLFIFLVRMFYVLMEELLRTNNRNVPNERKSLQCRSQVALPSCT